MFFFLTTLCRALSHFLVSSAYSFSRFPFSTSLLLGIAWQRNTRTSWFTFPSARTLPDSPITNLTCRSLGASGQIQGARYCRFTDSQARTCVFQRSFFRPHQESSFLSKQQSLQAHHYLSRFFQRNLIHKTPRLPLHRLLLSPPRCLRAELPSTYSSYVLFPLL